MVFKPSKTVLSIWIYMIILFITLVNTGFFPSLGVSHLHGVFDSSHIFYHTGTLIYDNDFFGGPEYLLLDDTGKIYSIAIFSDYLPLFEEESRVRFSGDLLYDPTMMLYFIRLSYLSPLDSLNLNNLVLFSCVFITPSIYSASLLRFFKKQHGLNTQ